MQCTCLNFQDFREEADLEKKIAFKNVAWNEQKKKKKTELASIYNTPIIFFCLDSSEKFSNFCRISELCLEFWSRVIES